MTSKPASRARTAICSAPLECPSSPGLPTRKRSRPPSSFPVARTCSRTPVSVSSASPPPEAADTPDDVLAALHPPAPLGQGADQLALHVVGLDGGHRTAHLLHPGDLGPRAL